MLKLLVVALTCAFNLGLQLSLKAEGTLEVSGNILPHIGTGYETRIDLGNLEAGKKQKIRLELFNNNPEILPVKEMGNFAGTISALSSDKEIPVGGSTILDLTLDVPVDAKTVEQLWGFTILGSNPRNNISVKLAFRIGSLLSFRRANIFLASLKDGAKDITLEIPMFITEPIQAKSIEFETEEGLEGFSCSIEGSGNEFLLRCHKTNLEGYHKSLRGKVTVRDHMSGRKAAVGIVVEVKKRFTIAPSSIRFTKADDGTFVARSLLQINYKDREENIEQDAPKRPRLADLSATFSVESGTLETDVVEIGNGVYRFDYVWSPNIGEKKAKASPNLLRMSLTSSLGQEELDFPVRFTPLH